METVTRKVGELSAPDRSAMERVVGHRLHDSQQFTVNVFPRMELHAPSTPIDDVIPSHWNVYEGLGEAEIEKLDAAIRVRANFTRSFE